MIYVPVLIVVQDQQPSLGYQVRDSVSEKKPPQILRSDYDLITPAKEEYDGFKFLFTGYTASGSKDMASLANTGYYSAYSWTIKRQTDNLMIDITLAVSANPEVVGMVSSLGASHVGKSVHEKKTSFSGKPIGKYAWSYPNVLFVEDNWLLMKIDLRPQNTRNPDNSVTSGSVTDADRVWAEEIGRKILDRATVLGLTRHPASSAPGWAKEQIAKRRAERKQ
jgi:hypothetical protein